MHIAASSDLVCQPSCLSKIRLQASTYILREECVRESSVAEVLDEPYSQLTPLSGVAVQARQSTYAGTMSILCSLAGRYSYPAELAYLSKVRLKLPLLHG
jgi:hypothetical protein